MFTDSQIVSEESKIERSQMAEQQAEQIASLFVSSLKEDFERSSIAERRSGVLRIADSTRIATSLFGGTVSVAPRDAIVSYTHFMFDCVADAPQQTKTPLSDVTKEDVIVGSTAVVTTSLSVGYVVWILRGGSLLTAFVSALPTWSSFDPLPVCLLYTSPSPRD